MIPYGRQEVSAGDIDAVVEVLRSDFLTQGPAVPRFEQELAAYCGGDFALAVSHGTAGLHLACLAMGLGPGDRLWISAVTFVASANCGLYCGASIDLVDIDPETRNMSIDALTAKLENAEREGTLPAVVVAVHFGGLPCDMERIAGLARRYGFRVVEDASHALGGRYGGEPIGACRYSDAAVFSFHPVKNITTGEGGAVVTNDSELAQRVAGLRTHGITRDSARMRHESHGPWYYEQVETGFNYRMTDMQAALGSSQLQRLDDFIAARRSLAARYDQLLANRPLVLPMHSAEAGSAWHLYPIELSLDERWSMRRRIFEQLRERGWGVNVHYIPLHYQPDIADRLSGDSAFPAAENYYAGAMSLPLFPALTHEQQDAVVGDLDAAVAAATSTAS
jgi:UDP-4-amino-4,6-dideoxy-N-acetyl-beta-L-altrosamine transaminase